MGVPLAAVRARVVIGEGGKADAGRRLAEEAVSTTKFMLFVVSNKKMKGIVGKCGSPTRNVLGRTGCETE